MTVDGLPCGWMTWDDHVDCPGSSADYEVLRIVCTGDIFHQKLVLVE